MLNVFEYGQNETIKASNVGHINKHATINNEKDGVTYGSKSLDYFFY